MQLVCSEVVWVFKDKMQCIPPATVMFDRLWQAGLCSFSLNRKPSVF